LFGGKCAVILVWYPVYWGFSFKSTGVTRDPIYQFDISTAAEFLRDTPKISTFSRKFSFFFAVSGSFEACAMAWMFDRGSGDACPQRKFVLDKGVRDA
jgi:hypothetical protein